MAMCALTGSIAPNDLVGYVFLYEEVDFLCPQFSLEERLFRLLRITNLTSLFIIQSLQTHWAFHTIFCIVIQCDAALTSL